MPSLDDLLQHMGEVGTRLSEISAAEGAAGNMSLCLEGRIHLNGYFPLTKRITLPQPAPSLAGRTLIVTGSGQRLRDISADPSGTLGALVIALDGVQADLYTAPTRRFERLTSELNSHLAAHDDRVRMTGAPFHALIHAQPLHLTYLSHLPRYQDERTFNRQLMRWEAELIIFLSEGIGVLPFFLPGSDALMQATVTALRDHQLVQWGKHGVMSRSDSAIKHACDLIDYAETAARYEMLNLMTGEQGEGLSEEQIRAVALRFGVTQHLF